MPKFDRKALAQFLPDPRTIAAFEQLNTNVDVDLPKTIEETNYLANQAHIAAIQALAQIDEVFARVDALELLPPLIPASPVDDLAPVSVSSGPADNLGPV